jgi:probable F420-dependent oxidoreductase
MQRFGFSFPFEHLSLGESRDVVRRAEQRGYTDAWSWEIDGVDCFTPLALASQWTERMRLGTAIANVYSRSAAVLAMQAAALAEVAPGRCVLGIGSSSPAIVQDWSGIPFEEPYQQTRDVAKILRRVLAGERVTVDRGRVHASNLRLSRPLAGPVPLYIAALREGMLQLAGRLGDGVLINWLSPDDVRRVTTIARDAAAVAGKEPAMFDAVCRIFVCVSDDREAADVAARRAICAYLTTPVYAAFHRWLGRGEQLEPMIAAWNAGDRRGATAAVPRRLIDDVLVVGSADRCRERIAEYVAAGVTTPMLHFVPLINDVPPAKQVLEMLWALAPDAG